MNNYKRLLHKFNIFYLVADIEEHFLKKFEIDFEEHIFSKKRQENDSTLTNSKNLEAIGNKVLLEDKINIRAADYRFSDKVKYYKGFTNDKGHNKAGTIITELLNLADSNTDFTEEDILNRTEKITTEFINYLKSNSLVK